RSGRPSSRIRRATPSGWSHSSTADRRALGRCGSPGQNGRVDAPFAALTHMPSPQYVMTPECYRSATYRRGAGGGRTVLCVHVYASSCRANWLSTGWERDLTRGGFRVLGVDQRGHGASDKPDDPRAYAMDSLVGDLVAVLDTHLLDSVLYAGYSLGARVGWQ